MRTSALLSALLVTVCSMPMLLAQDAQPSQAKVFPFYGTVSGSNVRLRGGPGDYHAVLSEMGPNAILKIHGAEGNWYEVEIPGGLPLYVCARRGENVYVHEESPGRGVVRASTLNVRGTRNTDYPPLTQLKTGDRLLILDEKDDWFRVMAPAGTHAWVHKDFVKGVPDQKAAEALFVRSHVEAERQLLESGARSRLMLKAEADQVARKEDAKKIFETYDQEKAKAAGARDIDRVRADLVRVRDAAPEGDPDRARADALLQTLDDWARLKKAWTDLEQKRKEAAREADSRYSEELAALRKEVEEKRRREDARRAERNTMNGWIRRIFPVKGVINKGPNYALFRGNQKHFLLESDRYDFADFTNKLVVLLRTSKPEERPGLAIRVVKVMRMEILGSDS